VTLPGTVPRLPALVHPLLRTFVDDATVVRETVDRFGSPLHVVFPAVLAENLQQLREVLDGMQHTICYAHKVNQSSALVREALAHGISVDVASAAELAHAIGCGFPENRVEVTGPKGLAFLAEILKARATINVDNLWELEQVAALAADQGADQGPPRPRVLLRITAPEPEAGRIARVSRFGITRAEAVAALTTLARHRGLLDFLGFSFHVDSGDVRDRLRAIQTCLVLTESAYAHGLTPRVLDIGGGLRQRFTDNPDAYEDYLTQMRQGLTSRGPALTWAGNTLGLTVDGEAVRGTPVFHKYGNAQTAAGSLRELLDADLPGHSGRPIRQLLRDAMLELWLEPGKGLADQSGVTVASVEFVKQLANGSTLVTLDISRDTITPADQEVMLDPLVVRRNPSRGAAVGAFLAGRLCLERDLVFTHTTYLDGLPDPGDLVVFPNTAAYQMDLSASQASMHPRPVRVAAVRTGSGFAICRDADYRATAGQR